MENLQTQMREAYNYLSEHMDPEQVTAFYNEFTQEEIVKFNMMNIANEQRKLALAIAHNILSDMKIDRLEAELNDTKRLAALAIFGTMSALTLIGTVAYLHVQDLEEETRKITKKKITLDTTAYRIGKQEKEAFITEMKLKGYTTKRWMRKYINESLGEKLF